MICRRKLREPSPAQLLTPIACDSAFFTEMPDEALKLNNGLVDPGSLMSDRFI